MRKDKWRLALVGCGRIGFRYDYGVQTEGAYTHFRAFMQSPYFDVAAVAEPDEATRALIEKEFGIAAYADYRTMLAAVEPDVVSIAAPDHLHVGILADCLEYRPRAVLCEKPLAGSQAEAESIVQKYKEAGIGLQVNFTRRFFSEFRTIAQAIANGELGAIQHVSIYYSRGLVHNASHYFDLLLFLFGEPQDVAVMRIREGLVPEDPTATVVLQYNGFDAILAGMASSTLLTNEIDIIGTQGRVQVTTDDVLVRSRVCVHPFYTPYTHFGEVERRVVDRSTALPAAIGNLHGFLQGTEELLSPGENSIRIFQLINRIQEQPSWRNWHYSAGQGR